MAGAAGRGRLVLWRRTQDLVGEGESRGWQTAVPRRDPAEALSPGAAAPRGRPPRGRWGLGVTRVSGQLRRRRQRRPATPTRPVPHPKTRRLARSVYWWTRRQWRMGQGVGWGRRGGGTPGPAPPTACLPGGILATSASDEARPIRRPPHLNDPRERQCMEASYNQRATQSPCRSSALGGGRCRESRVVFWRRAHPSGGSGVPGEGGRQGSTCQKYTGRPVPSRPKQAYVRRPLAQRRTPVPAPLPPAVARASQKNGSAARYGRE